MELKHDYKQTVLGEFPDDWRETTVGSFEPFVTSGSRGWAQYYSEYGDLFVRITNMNRTSIALDLEDCRFVRLPVSGHEGSRTQLAVGDILISITADIGIVSFVDSSIPSPAYINQHIALIRFDAADISPKFITYFLSHKPSQGRFHAITDQGAKAGINLLTVRNIPLILPPTKAEQAAIAAALSDVDALLVSLDRLIAKKRDIKQAAIQQLLTGQTRLPGFDGEWEVKRLGDHVTFLRNGVNSRAELTLDDTVKYLHYGDIHACSGAVLGPTALPSLPLNKAKNLERLCDGDLVFADASEDLTGVSKSVEIYGVSNIELVSGLHTIAARFDKSVLANGFKAYLQFCPAFSSHLRRLAAGTKVYATNRSHIASVEMRLPDVKEQIAIANVLSDIDIEITALEKRRNKTRDLKTAMMQELLTGKTRLI